MNARIHLSPNNIKFPLIWIAIALIGAVSMVSAADVDEMAGPFHVFFEVTAESVKTEIGEPFPEDTFTFFGLTTTSDGFFANIVIAKFNNPEEIDIDRLRRSVASSVGIAESQASLRVIDNRRAVYAIKSSDTVSLANAIYWLDEENGYGTQMVEITISYDDVSGIDKLLDSFKVEYKP